MLQQKKLVKNLDPPLIHRYEKHVITTESRMTSQEKLLIEELISWTLNLKKLFDNNDISKLLYIWNDDTKYFKKYLISLINKY